jgi:putative ABC transport system permease protein
MKTAARVSLQGLSKFKTRTLLMMLGIIVGIATLTVVVSISKGMQRKVTQSIQSFGECGDGSAGAARCPGHPRMLHLTLATRRRSDGAGGQNVAPFTVNIEQNIIAGARAPPPGSRRDTEFADPGSGTRRGGLHQRRGHRRSAATPSSVRPWLGAPRRQEPVGETSSQQHPFTVVGVLARRGTSPMGMDMDRRVMIPLTTAMRKMYNVSHLGMIRLYLDDSSRLQEATATVASISGSATDHAS